MGEEARGSVVQPSLSIPELSDEVVRRAGEYRDAFLQGQPFKHVVIEGFFDLPFAEGLLREFPRFDPNLATNEGGHAGGKAVNTRIREISPVYEKLYDLIAGKAFLDFVSTVSGVPDLILDPTMYGGGTHENLHGQELDPHVDFNYDQSRQLHRRLNLIVYLNKDWRTEWGGAIEIHSNPRKPFENRIISYDPSFNRCVMFETNEYSWHAFPAINLPEDRRHLSRKSISIYLYTRERPADEIAPEHGTFYVQRPLPKRMTAGYTLSEEDVAELQSLLIRRDQWIELYQGMELKKNRELAQLSRHIVHLGSQARAPLTGYVSQEGPATGLYGDGWVASRVRLQIRPLMPVAEIVLRGYRPESAPAGSVEVSTNGVLIGRLSVVKGKFEIAGRLRKPAEVPFWIEMTCDAEGSWAEKDGDGRDLAFILTELRARHPGCKDPL
jgi:hypothetical protein